MQIFRIGKRRLARSAAIEATCVADTHRGVGHLTLIGAFAPALRVLAPVLREATQFVGALHGGPICQHLSDANTEQDTRRARLRNNVGRVDFKAGIPKISWQPC